MAKNGRFWIKVSSLDAVKQSVGLLSPQSKSKGPKPVETTMYEVVKFLQDSCGMRVEFDIEEGMYKMDDVYYSKNQLVFKANKIRSSTGKKKFDRAG